MTPADQSSKPGRTNWSNQHTVSLLAILIVIVVAGLVLTPVQAFVVIAVLLLRVIFLVLALLTAIVAFVNLKTSEFGMTNHFVRSCRAKQGVATMPTRGSRPPSCCRTVTLLVLMVFGCRPNPRQTYRIGAVLPLSGPSARYGTWIQQGLELAQARVDSAGGINGHPLQIVFEDGQAQPAQAAAATQKLINVDHVPIIFGSWASSAVLAQAPIAERHQVILMAEAISPKIRTAGDFIFRIQPDARYYLRALVPYLVRRFRPRSAAVMYINNDFGVDQANLFKSLLDSLASVEATPLLGYAPGTSDFRPFLTRLLRDPPDIVFLAGYAELGTILSQAKGVGLRTQFVGSVPTENPDLLAVAGSAADGIIYPSHFDLESHDSLAIAFRETYKQRFGTDPEGFAALAYDGLLVLADAARKCGAVTTCIRDFLYHMPPKPGVTGTTSFDNMGDVVKPIIIKTVVDGQFRAVTDSVGER